MNDKSSNTGQTRQPPSSEKPFTFDSKRSEPFSEKSPLPHKQKTETTNPTRSERSPSDRRADAAAILRGETQDKQSATGASTREADASASASPTTPHNTGKQPTDDQVSDGLLVSDGPVGAGNIPDTFDPKFLAEQLGIKPAELYERLQLTTQEGDTISFGEWKDRVTSMQSQERAHIEREQNLDRREAGMRETLQLLQSVGADVAAKFPQAQQALADYSRQIKAQERRAAVTAMPELADETYRAQFTKDVADHLSQFGFRASEINIMDHRILLALRDAIKTKRQLDKLMAFEPTQNPPKSQRPQGKRQRTSKTDQLVASAKGGTTADKVAAAGAILRGNR